MARAGRGLFAVVAATALLAALPADAGTIAPHRALYDLSLASTRASGGVVGVEGRMMFQWGDTCDGWTIEQRYRMRLIQAQEDQVDIVSNLVTWESKDGSRYRFTLRKKRGGEPEEEIRGSALLQGAGKEGQANFTRPEPQSIELPAGTMFPTAHTIELIRRAEAKEAILSRRVFDGSEVEDPVEVNAVIGRLLPPDPADEKLGPLLARPGWRVRLAFFPAEGQSPQPDYEIGLRLLDNGVSTDMIIDYGDFSVRARLREVEALPGGC
jgi:hypothetical protein